MHIDTPYSDSLRPFDLEPAAFRAFRSILNRREFPEALQRSTPLTSGNVPAGAPADAAQSAAGQQWLRQYRAACLRFNLDPEPTVPALRWQRGQVVSVTARPSDRRPERANVIWSVFTADYTQVIACRTQGAQGERFWVCQAEDKVIYFNDRCSERCESDQPHGNGKRQPCGAWQLHRVNAAYHGKGVPLGFRFVFNGKRSKLRRGWTVLEPVGGYLEVGSADEAEDTARYLAAEISDGFHDAEEGWGASWQFVDIDSVAALVGSDD